METTNSIVALDAIEIRILGSLIEKSKTTPENYPLTVNSMMLACNQKSSRKPIVQYDEETVISGIDRLKKKAFISAVTGGGSRSLKYKHNFDSMYHFTAAETAVLCLLFLRGPLTPGEINSNAGRLHEFTSIESVLEVLGKLSGGDTPFVKQLPRKSGQKELRYMHLFGNPEEYLKEEQPEAQALKSSESIEQRMGTLERDLAELKSKFEKLYSELMG